MVGAGRQLLLTTRVVLLVCVCWGGDRGREICMYLWQRVVRVRHGSFCVNVTRQCCLNLTRQWLCELDRT